MGRLVSCVDRKKRGNRYDVPKDHGFRKFYGTVIKDTQGITATMSEKLINHIGVVQLDGSYFKPTKEQMFEAYQKVILGLTIDQTEKQKSLIESQKKKITDLERKELEIQEVKKNQKRLEKRYEWAEGIIMLYTERDYINQGVQDDFEIEYMKTHKDYKPMTKEQKMRRVLEIENILREEWLELDKKIKSQS